MIILNSIYRSKYCFVIKSQNTKIRTVTIRLDSKITDIRLKGYRDIISYLELMKEFEAMDSTFKYFTKIGYSTIKSEDYKKMVNDVKVKQNQIQRKSLGKGVFIPF